MASSDPYALVNHIPLIKAPGMWVPKPVSVKLGSGGRGASR